MEAQGLLAIDAPRVEPRRRQEHTLLVVGDEGVHRLAVATRRLTGASVTTFDISLGTTPPEPWHDMVIDAAALDRLRELHPDMLRRAGRLWVVTTDDLESGVSTNPFTDPLPLLGRVLKRAMDITIAFLGLLFVLPVMLVAMVVVRLDSPGPALFRQVRMGNNGRRFRLYKLRTMRHGNDDRVHREYVARLIAGTGERCGDVYKLLHDPRITRVGRFLRKVSIDELPQLWNVLKGDMSLVGPRPPLPHEVELYNADAWRRLRVKPGITGLWQVSGRCELSFEDMVSLDVRYWQQWSLSKDLAIFLKTPQAVLSGRGAG